MLQFNILGLFVVCLCSWGAHSCPALHCGSWEARRDWTPRCRTRRSSRSPRPPPPATPLHHVRRPPPRPAPSDCTAHVASTRIHFSIHRCRPWGRIVPAANHRCHSWGSRGRFWRHRGRSGKGPRILSRTGRASAAVGVAVLVCYQTPRTAETKTDYRLVIIKTLHQFIFFVCLCFLEK